MESERQVPRADGEKLASEYGIKFYETSVHGAPCYELDRNPLKLPQSPREDATSARSNTNVSEAFLTLATDVRSEEHERRDTCAFSTSV
eukprot:scaffold141614_cov42-Tisochrysis_lutea.AAC.2